MVKVNNLKDLDEGQRKEIANSPALLDFMVAAYGERGDLVAEVRAAKSARHAQEIAKAVNLELKAVHGKTVDDVYAATGDSPEGPADGSEGCKPPSRWDPITQTCVPQ